MEHEIVTMWLQTLSSVVGLGCIVAWSVTSVRLSISVFWTASLLFRVAVGTPRRTRRAGVQPFLQ